MKEITRREALKRIFAIVLTVPLIAFFTKNVFALNFWVNGPDDMIEYNDVKDVVGLNTPLTFFANITTLKTDFELVSVVAGKQLRLVSIFAHLDGDATTNPSVQIGFGVTNLDTEVASHPGVRRGSGISDRGSKQDPIAIGAVNEELRLTNTVPSSGSFDVYGSYYLEDV